MNHFEKTWKAKDGQRTYCQYWEPETDIRAIVCLVHGLGEHSGRYAHVAEHLNRAGFALLSADLRGHGKSDGMRGHIASSDIYLDHIDRLLDEARRQGGDLPLFLYGHSLGGIAALFYVLKHPPEWVEGPGVYPDPPVVFHPKHQPEFRGVRGVVVTSPGLRTALENQALKIFLAKTIGAVLPAARMPTGLDAEQISRDPEVVRRYKSDPLVHDQASAALAKYTLEMIPWIFEHAPEFSLPLLIMHGAADKIAYSWGSVELAGEIGPMCTLHIWNDMYHELHNEPEKDQVLDQITAWMERQL